MPLALALFAAKLKAEESGGFSTRDDLLKRRNNEGKEGNEARLNYRGFYFIRNSSRLKDASAMAVGVLCNTKFSNCCESNGS